MFVMQVSTYYNLNVFPIGFRSGPVDDVLSNSALAHWKAKLAAVDPFV